MNWRHRWDCLRQSLPRRSADASARHCRNCRHFENRPDVIEAAFPNLAAMSSGFGSVRGDDGLCGLRGIYLSARAGCGEFEPVRVVSP
jgi:hypothetical protein